MTPSDTISEMLRDNFRYYTDQAKNFNSILRDIVLKPFNEHYQKDTKNIYATDGSYVVYGKIPILGIYFTSVIAVGVEQQYIHNENPKLREYKSSNYDKMRIDPIFTFREDIIKGMDSLKGKNIKWIIEMVMNRMEKKLLYNHAKFSENHLIMVDGSLIQQGKLLDPPEKAKLLIGESNYNFIKENATVQELTEICNKKHILTGVSKDSNVSFYLRNEKTGFTYEYMLERARIAQELPNKCYYYEIPEFVVEELKKTLNADPSLPIGICYARLHPMALKWHRIDYIKDSNFDLEKDILPTIAAYSQVYTAYGSPWTPQVCHKIAKRIRDESPIKQEIIQKKLVENGYSINDLIETDVNGDSMIETFHDYTDKVI